MEDGFDGVCICTGTNTWASLPCFKGQECFKGEIVHSEKYRSADVSFRVVCVVAWQGFGVYILQTVVLDRRRS